MSRRSEPRSGWRSKGRQRELDVLEVNIENSKKHKLKAIKDRTEREIRVIETNARTLAIILPPIPALILGLFVFGMRAKDERQGIVPDRLVGHK